MLKMEKKPIFINFVLFIYDVCGQWRLADNFWKLVLFFHHMGLGIKFKCQGLETKALTTELFCFHFCGFLFYGQGHTK